MKPLMAAIWCEGLKTYKTRVFWLSVAFFIFIALMISLIMYVQIHPEISEKLGIIGTKASLLRFGEPIWQNYFTLLLQTVAAIGLVGYGFVTSWVFGREYSDKTAKDILALPVSRSDIVLSKFIISLSGVLFFQLYCCFLRFCSARLQVLPDGLTEFFQSSPEHLPWYLF